MHVLIQDSKVIHGPIQYSKSIFERVLNDELEQHVSIPPTRSDTESVVITDTIKILPVASTPGPQYNRLTEQLAGPYWAFEDGVARASYNVVSKPIRQVQNELKAKSAEIRWKKETAGTKVTIQGKEVPVYTNRDDRQIYLQAYQLATEPQSWKFSDGTWLTLTEDDLGTIVQAIATWVKDAFSEESTRASQIDAATDSAALLAIWESMNPVPTAPRV